jgi:hypothetical protein
MERIDFNPKRLDHLEILNESHPDATLDYKNCSIAQTAASAARSAQRSVC